MVMTRTENHSFLSIKLEGNKHLTDRMTVAGVDLLAVGSSKNCQTLLKRIERESINRCVNCEKKVLREPILEDGGNIGHH